MHCCRYVSRTFPWARNQTALRLVATHPDLMQGAGPHCSLENIYNNLVDRGLLQQDEQQLKTMRSLNAVLENVKAQQKLKEFHQGGRKVDSPVNSPVFLIGEAKPSLNSTVTNITSKVTEWWNNWKNPKDDFWTPQDASQSSTQNEENALELYQNNLPAVTTYEAKASGLYIYGEVGCGKTMLMDMFYHAVPIPLKRRVHLAMFMSEVYQRLHMLTEQKKYSNVIQALAEEIAEESRVLCFDEFQVTDIGDAVLLTQLFTYLFRLGVVVVATSNKAPDTLYNINTEFGKFVDMMKKHCVLHYLPRSRDYRKTGTPCPNVYLTPHSDENANRLFSTFSCLTEQPVVKASPLFHSGRAITVPYTKGPCALFSFDYLCDDTSAMGTNDYSCIAKTFHTICVTNIPLLGLHNRSATRRFISLIDELYRYRVKLICTAAYPLEKLFAYEELTAADTSEHFDEYYAQSTTEREQGRFFIDFNDDFGEEYSNTRKASPKDMVNDKRFTGEEEVFALKRVQSRMQEMMTEEYLRLQHMCFTTQDVNIRLLLNGANA